MVRHLLACSKTLTKLVIGSNTSFNCLKMFPYFLLLDLSCFRAISPLTVHINTRVYLLDFFCSGIQFYLLLSPYVCFISLYILIYMFWEMMHDKLGVFHANQISMSWSTYELRVRLAPLNRFKPSSKIFYWPFQGGTSFVDLFFSVLCLLCLCEHLFICAL